MARRTATLLTLALALALSACGGDEDDSPPRGEAPAAAAASFPAAKGESLESLIEAAIATDQIVVAPAGQVFASGDERFPFGVFSVDGEQITDADAAIYAESPSGAVTGPHPARIESLETDPAFVAQTTAQDPDSAKVVYVANVPFARAGEWRLLALVREGEELLATRLPSVVVGEFDDVPAPGDRAPRVHTPTATDVGGNLERIDTRIPPSSMHEDDLADVLGREPVVLLFATPALCQSRVCGPVVDVVEQVKADYDDEAAFIHMEIYEDNEPPKLREQVKAYNLPSEPWLFVIDEDGRVQTRLEGAFSAAEIERALQRVI